MLELLALLTIACLWDYFLFLPVSESISPLLTEKNDLPKIIFWVEGKREKRAILSRVKRAPARTNWVLSKRRTYYGHSSEAPLLFWTGMHRSVLRCVIVVTVFKTGELGSISVSEDTELLSGCTRASPHCVCSSCSSVALQNRFC